MVFKRDFPKRKGLTALLKVYVVCVQLFRILFRTMNYQYDYTFDWTILRQRKQHMEAGAAPADRRSPSVQRRAQQQPSQPPPNNEVHTPYVN